MRYIEVTGKTEEEALSKALEQLGMDRDDVSVEILERAKSGFLGIGGQPAKIRVSYGAEEEVEEPEQKPCTEVKKPAPAPAEKVPAAQPVKPVKEPAAVPAAGEEVDDEKAQAIKAFLTGLFEQMNCRADIHVYLPEKGRYKVILEG